MSITKALAVAKDRVRMVPLGGQWTLHTWSPKHNATWVTSPMTYPAACATLKEFRIREALQLLDVEDADYEASQWCQRPGRWEHLARLAYNESKGGGS